MGGSAEFPSEPAEPSSGDLVQKLKDDLIKVHGQLRCAHHKVHALKAQGDLYALKLEYATQEMTNLRAQLRAMEIMMEQHQNLLDGYKKSVDNCRAFCFSKLFPPSPDNSSSSPTRMLPPDSA